MYCICVRMDRTRILLNSDRMPKMSVSFSKEMRRRASSSRRLEATQVLGSFEKDGQ